MFFNKKDQPSRKERRKKDALLRRKDTLERKANIEEHLLNAKNRSIKAAQERRIKQKRKTELRRQKKVAGKMGIKQVHM